MLDASSSSSSSEAEIGVGLYDPEEIQLSMFSASSGPEEPIEAQDSSSSVIVEGVPEIVDDSFFLSEAGLEALDVAEKILKEGYDGDESSAPSESSSVADFDGASDVNSLVQDSADLDSSASG